MTKAKDEEVITEDDVGSAEEVLGEETTGTDVVDWKKDMAVAAARTAKAERPASSNISLKGGIMTYMDEPLVDNQLECVIVAASFARTCFQRPYDPDDQGPPECFSNAFEVHDLVPHENVPEPYAKVCGEKTCEWAVFGTALQGKGPRCKTRRKLIVMPISGLKDPAEAEIATITVTPTSGQNYSSYAAKIANQGGLPPWAVKTMITVKPHAKKQFEVTFATTGKIEDDKALAGIHSRIAEADSILLTPYTYDAEEAPAAESDKY
jgi:hypothetical protein